MMAVGIGGVTARVARLVDAFRTAAARVGAAGVDPAASFGVGRAGAARRSNAARWIAMSRSSDAAYSGF
jgi:5-carboxymethyl-2-hydroxymuconate isomerase